MEALGQRVYMSCPSKNLSLLQNLIRIIAYNLCISLWPQSEYFTLNPFATLSFCRQETGLAEVHNSSDPGPHPYGYRHPARKYHSLFVNQAASAPYAMYRMLCLFPWLISEWRPCDYYKCLWFFTVEHKQTGFIFQMSEHKGALHAVVRAPFCIQCISRYHFFVTLLSAFIPLQSCTVARSFLRLPFPCCLLVLQHITEIHKCVCLIFFPVHSFGSRATFLIPSSLDYN